MPAPAELKDRLPHTWPVFFARHGNFTAVQRQAIPPILAGKQTLIMAATASGKTEAALAPLLERHLFHKPAGEPALRILYICPTRALVRDLYERLTTPLARLGIALGIKSGDTGPVSLQTPPTVLITTPESVDSLLTRGPRLFIPLRGLVLDEIHLFDHSPRGDQLRCLLARIAHIQSYHAQQSGETPPPLQRVALSATVPDPAGVVQRYLLARESYQSEVRGYQSEVQSPESGAPLKSRSPAPPGLNCQSPQEEVAIVAVGGGRRLAAQIEGMRNWADLVAALVHRAGSETGVRKALIFCNTRNEVEQAAAYLRQHLPYSAAIFVHYSNLDSAMRRSVEERFAAASVAICVSSSTLELGIDIGSIDDVVLVGPPPTTAAFLQRLGRGGRRRQTTLVLCLARSPLEEVRFQALLELADLAGASNQKSGFSPPRQADLAYKNLVSSAPAYHFRPSVLVQQIFSLLKQSPIGAIRLADLRRLAPTSVSDEELRRLLRHLAHAGYLQSGRPGEWRAGAALDPLLEEHEIYSNIGADPLATVVVDAYSGQTLAQTQELHQPGEQFLLGGRRLEVVWRDRYRIGVQATEPTPADATLRFPTAPFAVPLAVSQAVAHHLGVSPNQLCLIHTAAGAWLFHFWGDLYGALLAGLLQEQLRREDETAIVTVHNELCLYLPLALGQLPTWEAALALRQLHRLSPRVEPFLALGRFHSLLPPALAEKTVLALCDLPRFEQIYRSASLLAPPASLRSRLLELI